MSCFLFSPSEWVVGINENHDYKMLILIDIWGREVPGDSLCILSTFVSVGKVA
jgi:hypothetical protein